MTVSLGKVLVTAATGFVGWALVTLAPGEAVDSKTNKYKND
jgi:nucleoside-diphosphate-sugar epimerase